MRFSLSKPGSFALEATILDANQQVHILILIFLLFVIEKYRFYSRLFCRFKSMPLLKAGKQNDLLLLYIRIFFFSTDITNWMGLDLAYTKAMRAIANSHLCTNSSLTTLVRLSLSIYCRCFCFCFLNIHILLYYFS